jgi:probable phosphoglycerate mutase
MPEVVIIRSGCTDFDEQNRIKGSLEIPINSQGEKQIRQVVEQLAQTPLEIIFADSSEPSLSTAETIGEALNVKVQLSDELRNLDQGLWEGLQVEDVRHKYPRVFKQWRESPETICPPEGELASEAMERIAKVLRKPLKKRDCFAIVASEPLATLISWLVSEQKSELPDPCSCCGDKPRVQIVHCGTELSDAPLARTVEMETTVETRSPFYVPPTETNGRNGNGKDRREGGAE